MNTYFELWNKQQAEVNAFPMEFAFNEKQFEEGMRNLGLDPSQTDEIYQLGNTGGFIRKSDAAAFGEMMDRHELEMKEAIQTDSTGDGFIFYMFDYELSNHEYNYTGDPSDAIEALGLTYEEIAADSRLHHGFQKACKRQKGV